MAAYLRFHDPWKLIESIRQYIFTHPKCSIVSDANMMTQMYDFYVEPEPGEPYEVKTGWTIGAFSIIGCRSDNLNRLFFSPEGRNTLIREIRSKDFGKKRTRYEILASDDDVV